MFTNSAKGEVFYAAASRPSVAKRQLEMSIGAVAVIAMVAVGAAFSARSNATVGNDQVAHATPAPVVVKAAVRMVPSERLQATDQTRLDRRS